MLNRAVTERKEESLETTESHDDESLDDEELLQGLGMKV